MTDSSSSMSTVDDLKRKLEPILAKIRGLKAQVEALEQENCPDLMGSLTMAQHRQPRMRSLEDNQDVARRGHDIARLKVRLQHLELHEGKFKRQVRNAKSFAQRECCVRRIDDDE